MSSILEVLEARPFPAKVAQVLDPHRLVINRGAKDRVQEGRRFIVFGIGPDIIDPETGQSLGKVELVRGTGVVTHVQDLQATIESDKTEPPQRRVIKQGGFSAFGLSHFTTPEETVFSPPVYRPFEDAATGDFAKPI